jgi:hypothetical protein
MIRALLAAALVIGLAGAAAAQFLPLGLKMQVASPTTAAACGPVVIQGPLILAGPVLLGC